MGKIKEIVQKKPLFFLLVSLVYLFFVGLLKWKLTPPPGAVLYLAGGAIGVYFLDIAEVFFNLHPSPFRTIVFVGAFSVVSFFVVTSSGSFVGSGLVLSLYLSLILWQIGQWRLSGNLNSWYGMVATVPSVRQQQWLLFAFIAIFLAETYFFIR
ncbi:hypothetical protein HY409_04260 [Candidatus Gottesmanbacteria bacterium]|nr:hypothetical protein [Candidatus Gottesmanbacteria bacterium]